MEPVGEFIGFAHKVLAWAEVPSVTPDRKCRIYFDQGDYLWFDVSAVVAKLMKSEGK